MFKRFSNVFGFTFNNQVKSGGYKALTIIVTLLLIVVPIAIFTIVAMNVSDEEDGLKPCGADKIYVANEYSPNADYEALNQLGVKGYDKLTYIKIATPAEAFTTIKNAGETTSLVLYIYKEEGGLNAKVLIPNDSAILKDDANNLKDFLSEQNFLFTVYASGVSLSDLSKLSFNIETEVYSTAGYADNKSIYDSDSEALDEKNNKDILTVFNMILIYVTIMVVYFVVLYYGNSISQTVVMEKSSKLMDTMLVSVSPNSLIFGKMLGVLAAGFIQFFAWVAGAAVGIIAGVKCYEAIAPDNSSMIITFFKSFGKMGLFTIGDILIAVLMLIFGIVFYCSLSAIGGSISSTKEEAAANQGVFVMLLVISFYAVLILGSNTTDVPTWLYLFPGTSAMMLPAAVCTGMISPLLALAGLGITVVCTLLLLLLAGKLYTMMALYSGKKLNIGSALKMVFSKS
ncbi:MAG: ABC transporter permease [Lachnospiraceae bacterium]|nr:ABC transporter permease [Lachnospiraceae bacterium]